MSSHQKEAFESYGRIRFEFDPRRQCVWNEIIRYLEILLGKPHSVLDLGAGYCSAINASSADRKYACDIRPEFIRYAEQGVHTYVGSCTDLAWLPQGEILDWVIASNLFEHLSRNELANCLAGIRARMRPSCRLIIIQPNFKLCYRNYFDDYTHLCENIFTHTSMADYLLSRGFMPTLVYGRFLPFSLKSRFPIHRCLIAAYLRSPLKPLAGQMLVVAEPMADA